MTKISRGLRPAIATLVLACALPLSAAAETLLSTKGEVRTNAWITGYTFWDNSPPASAAIARPVIHDEAGGIGSYEDPITIAVGRHGKTWHYAPGTRIYMADLRKYAVVEDLCGACSGAPKARPHLDIYIGGADTTARAANTCAHQITSEQAVVIHPAPGYPVNPGEIAKSGCKVF